MADSVVTGALIEGGRILLCHRSPGRRWYPDVWDLPGGHVELGETPTEALERELLEELGVSVYSLPPGPLMRLSMVDVEMGIWFVGSWNGTPANLAPEEHDAIAWFTAEELTALEMAHPSYLDLFRAILRAPPNEQDQSCSPGPAFRNLE
jgi:8-oxo-dGTP pyrophosphatase MutT (NUDIX family)